MLEAALADAVLVLHFAYILFVALGGLAVARWPTLVWVHLPAAGWGVLVELMNWPCPLTPLENHLRRLAGERGYEDTFVEHYLLPWIYPGHLDRGLQLILAAAIVVGNASVYGLVLWWRRSRKRRSVARDST